MLHEEIVQERRDAHDLLQVVEHELGDGVPADLFVRDGLRQIGASAVARPSRAVAIARQHGCPGSVMEARGTNHVTPPEARRVALRPRWRAGSCRRPRAR